jgi:hypothetical protein
MSLGLALALAKAYHPDSSYRFSPFLHSSATVSFGFAEAIPYLLNPNPQSVIQDNSCICSNSLFFH